MVWKCCRYSFIPMLFIAKPPHVPTDRTTTPGESTVHFHRAQGPSCSMLRVLGGSLIVISGARSRLTTTAHITGRITPLIILPMNLQVEDNNLNHVSFKHGFFRWARPYGCPGIQETKDDENGSTPAATCAAACPGIWGFPKIGTLI